MMAAKKENQSSGIVISAYQHLHQRAWHGGKRKSGENSEQRMAARRSAARVKQIISRGVAAKAWRRQTPVPPLA